MTVRRGIPDRDGCELCHPWMTVHRGWPRTTRRLKGMVLIREPGVSCPSNWLGVTATASWSIVRPPAPVDARAAATYDLVHD
jgi:hypothetical protein